MARNINTEEYVAKQNEILDAAQRLIYTRGYTQMTIQDILGELKISKGAFYHYFDSKSAVLEALVERMQRQAEEFLLPLIHDPDLPALTKLERFFTSAIRWKTDQKDYLMAMLRGWYTDENALVRTKMQDATAQWNALLLAEILRQGQREGVLSLTNPDLAAEIATGVMVGMGERLSRVFLENNDEKGYDYIFQYMTAYTDTLEHVIGAPNGTLTLFEPDLLRKWFTPNSADD